MLTIQTLIKILEYIENDHLPDEGCVPFFIRNDTFGEIRFLRNGQLIRIALTEESSDTTAIRSLVEVIEDDVSRPSDNNFCVHLEKTVDVNGETWGLYGVKYLVDEGAYSTYVYAKSFDDAVKRLNVLKINGEVDGKVE